MPIIRTLAFLAAFALTGCIDFLKDTRFDHGIDSKALADLETQIWVDPEGCDHWIIDDGLEGYMSPRLLADGTPVCRPGAIPESIYNLEE